LEEEGKTTRVVTGDNAEAFRASQAEFEEALGLDLEGPEDIPEEIPDVASGVETHTTPRQAGGENLALLED